MVYLVLLGIIVVSKLIIIIHIVTDPNSPRNVAALRSH